MRLKEIARAAGVIISMAIVYSSCQQRSPKFNLYYVQGERLYEQHCANCHQQDGSGLGRIYPPLNESDFMEENFEEVICLIRNGISGEIIVNGQQYNQAMPAIPTLTDLEVAEIATYIYNTWDHQRGLIEVNDAAKILQRCDSIQQTNRIKRQAFAVDRESAK